MITLNLVAVIFINSLAYCCALSELKLVEESPLVKAFSGIVLKTFQGENIAANVNAADNSDNFLHDFQDEVLLKKLLRV
jgi:hypothetical protein